MNFIYIQDNIDNFSKIVFEYKQPFDFECTVGQISKILPDNWKNIDTNASKPSEFPLFNKAGNMQIVPDIGQKGMCRISLRPKYIMDKIIIDPDEVVVDVNVQQETNRLVYTFFNPTDRSSITIRAYLKKDAEGVCTKIKAHPIDFEWRQYHLRAAIKKQPDKLKPEDEFPEMMKAHQAAIYLGLSEKTIRNKTSSKEIPSHKIAGRSVRYKKSELDELRSK